MARKIVSPEPKTGTREVPSKTGFRSPFSVRGYPLQTARVYTLETLSSDPEDAPDPNGAFVRLRVQDASEGDLAAARAILLKGGARAVKVVAQAKPEVLTGLLPGLDAASWPVAPHQNLRAVVEAMVGEANTPNRDALVALVETTLSGVGL